MAKQQVTVPDIGGAEGAEVIELLVQVGDEVALDQGLIVLESDKASMEIPSTAAGVVAELLVSEGQELAEGAPVAIIEVVGGAAAPGSTAAVSTGAESTAAESTAAESTGAESTGAESTAAESTAVTAAGESQLVVVPDIGTDEAVELIELCVKAGDQLAEGDSIAVLESDKASMEVPAPFAGEVSEICVSEGDTVKQGDALLLVAGGRAVPAAGPESAAASAEPDGPAAPARTAPEPAPGQETAGDAGDNVYAGPAVRKLAREFGIALAAVRGSGPRGRILKEDLHQFVQDRLKRAAAEAGNGAAIPPVPEVDFSAFGDIEVKSRSKLDKLTASNMQRSWLNVPHVTQYDDADITEMEAFRAGMKAEAERRATRLTPLPFLLKACAVALRDNPKFCTSLADGGESLVFKRYIHIGMAVDTPAGLLVPVIRDVDRKSVWQLAEEALDLAARARERKLSPAQMQGGCFTISSLGSIGGRGFTPIVNAPEVAILGVSRAELRPVWDGQGFAPRKMLPLSLSYDHRVINGGDGGRFLTQLASLLGDIRRLIM